MKSYLLNWIKENRKTATVFLLLFFMVMAFSYFIFSFFYDKDYEKNQKADNLDIDLESQDERIKDELSNRFKDAQDYEIVLNSNGENKIFKYSDISVEYDLSSSIEIYKGNNESFDDIEFNYEYDNDKLDEILKSFQDSICEDLTEISIKDKKDTVILIKGKTGEKINISKAKKSIEESIANLKKAEPEIEIENLEFKYDLDNVYKKIYKGPENASVEKSSSNGYEIIPHEFGRDIDKDLLKEVLDKFKSTDDNQEVEVSILTPEITYEILESKIFKDTISSFTTSFSSSTEARATNVSLAASKINESIIAPGEIFSYNNHVGEATKASGFKEAPEYSNGKVVMGVGGGICQVSTTLHNAVLRNPDAESVSRSNHSFTVSYVDPGYDAAVSYGYLDYKFINNSKWPIKINAVTYGRSLNVSIIGTKDNNKVVSLSANKTKDIPYEIVYKDDENLLLGVEQVQNDPKNGMIVETFRTITEDGKTISSGKIYTSNYKALDKVILKGTKKDSGIENSEDKSEGN